MRVCSEVLEGFGEKGQDDLSTMSLDRKDREKYVGKSIFPNLKFSLLTLRLYCNKLRHSQKLCYTTVLPSKD